MILTVLFPRTAPRSGGAWKKQAGAERCSTFRLEAKRRSGRWNPRSAVVCLAYFTRMMLHTPDALPNEAESLIR